MAVVINGSGTVTGLAVGGLPDGSVDADTLAANSVTAAKIVDGTIVDAEVTSLAASKLTGDLPAISGANLTGIPAGNLTGALPSGIGGKLIGSKIVEFTTTISTTSTSDTTVHSFSYTKLPSTSTVFITTSLNVQVNENGDDIGWICRLFRDTTELAEDRYFNRSNVTVADNAGCINMTPSGIDTGSAGARTYYLKLAAQYGEAKTNLNASHDNMVVMEIEA